MKGPLPHGRINERFTTLALACWPSRDLKMSISINPIFPVIAAQGAAPDLVLQPGTVIDAEVLKLLSDDLVRIAISGLSIEVFSEIPLQVGQALQLAVSQTPEGISRGQGRRVR